MFSKSTLNENGITLIEILASIILISILIISFLALFSTTAKQNKASEEVIDATYAAQKHMEKISNFSRSSSFENLDQLYENVPITTKESSTVIEYPEGSFIVIITIAKPIEDNISYVQVEVIEKGKVRGKMETIVWWRGVS